MYKSVKTKDLKGSIFGHFNFFFFVLNCITVGGGTTWSSISRSVFYGTPAPQHAPGRVHGQLTWINADYTPVQRFFHTHNYTKGSEKSYSNETCLTAFPKLRWPTDTFYQITPIHVTSLGKHCLSNQRILYNSLKRKPTTDPLSLLLEITMSPLFRKDDL